MASCLSADPKCRPLLDHQAACRVVASRRLADQAARGRRSRVAARRQAERNQCTIEEGKRQVLAFYFSPPGLDSMVPADLRRLLRLEPYRIGQELKFLLREVPGPFLCINPDAKVSGTEVRDELATQHPRVVMLSGPLLMATLRKGVAQAVAAARRASWKGSLRDYNLQIADILRGSPTIECVYLNASDTLGLGLELIDPHGGVLRDDAVVICWSSRVDDPMARRAFAQGFFDEIGEALQAGGQRNPTLMSRLPVEAAFRAGVERFKGEGYCLGEQAAPHEQGHPHNEHPSELCQSCMPTVHGKMLLLTRIDGHVCRYGGGSASTLDSLISARGDTWSAQAWVSSRPV